MKIIHSITQMSKISGRFKKSAKLIGFVPTMGALHQGHLCLARQARKEADVVVMSIFVNPTQFAPREDFKNYPRNLKKDYKLAKAAGIDFIFYPNRIKMYPKEFSTYVEVGGVSNILCGRFRPGHFRGVATVVTKLFNIIGPDIAYFGQKDAQQAAIIKRMVRDLNMPVKIRVLPILREKDGLAMSSRNTYLNNQERKEALVLFEALNLAKKLVRQGKKNSRYIIERMRRIIKQKQTAKIDYIEIVDPHNLTPVRFIRDKVLIVLAVWIGKTRLIDNMIIRN